MKFEPIGDKVVIQVPQQESKSGIQLSRASQERPLIGDVIAVGAEVKYIKVGDKVCYTRFAPNEVEIDDETYFVMEEKQILTKLV